MGGGGHQQTWASIFNETRFSGDMIRNPLFGLVAYGMVFLSIILVICLADNNLLDFAVSQHNEAQAKRAKQLAEAEREADQSARPQADSTQSADQVQPAAQLPQPAQSLLPPSAPQENFSQPSPSQPGYLQQSLMQQGQYGQQNFSQPAYPSASAYQGYGQTGMQQMQPGAFSSYPQPQSGAYRQGGYQNSGAYYQGGYKTGPDGTTQVPMNRMVVNR